ncbi:MAG: DMT family transporter [Gemmobacter sp.]
MTLAADRPLPNSTLAAAGLILAYAVMVTYADNFVQVIASEGGLWQFQMLRTAMGLGIFGVLALVVRMRFRPRNWRGVLARSAVHSGAMLFYFASLGFLPVAQAVAGLFTAPIFVLLIGRFVYGHALGPVRIGAVAAGFVGVILVLAPEADAPAGWASLLPVAAGALYALANIALREWCPGESAESLTLVYMVLIGIAGAAGMAILWLFPQPVPDGTDGFILRGPVWFSAEALWWTLVQAAASVGGVFCMVRAYQLAEASRVAVFEYVLLPVAAIWAWLLWGQGVGATAALGMVLIVTAGVAIALRAR